MDAANRAFFFSPFLQPTSCSFSLESSFIQLYCLFFLHSLPFLPLFSISFLLPFSPQNASPRPSAYPSPRSLLMTERTDSAKTAIVRTLHNARSTKTPLTSSHPFYRSINLSVLVIFIGTTVYRRRQIIPPVLFEEYKPTKLQLKPT